MYRLSVKMNNQLPNLERLDRLQRSMSKSVPEEIVAALCGVAVGRLRELTPTGKRGRIKAGWEYSMHREGDAVTGVVSNTAEDTEKGKTILAVLEKGSHYSAKRIYPKRSDVLAFFWERYDKMIFARSVLAVDKKGFHMVQKTRRYMRTVYRRIGEVILAQKIKEIV